MKPLATRRSASKRSSVDERDEKINRLPREIDERRGRALRVFVASREKRGIPWNPLRIARAKGHETGTMASHILKGHCAMNEVWMLYIAADYWVAPQVIWGKDWPFPHLTPDYSDRNLQWVCRRWDGLHPAARKKLVALAGAYPDPT